MNLRKTKSGQSASKIKPPKFYQELQVLLPSFNEEEKRMGNVSLPPSDQIAETKTMKMRMPMILKNQKILKSILPFHQPLPRCIHHDSVHFHVILVTNQRKALIRHK
ncbi:hypothetical protein J6590_058271 [Homalodisca vitripennis]|nr:hypothetical protein J6590_058271 [Homalodisca vitripennis]